MTQANAFGVYPGVLPIGRTSFKSIQDFRNEFCWNDHRHALVDDLERLLGEITKIFRVCAIWVGGSFVTKKESPGDIDVVLIFDGREISAIDPNDLNLRTLVSPAGLRFLTGYLGVKVDVYTITWNPVIGSQDEESVEIGQYHRNRGYWDDFWQRQRQGQKDAAPDISWTPPRQGYAEVTINGYGQF